MWIDESRSVKRPLRSSRKTESPSVFAPQSKMARPVLCWITAQMGSANWSGAQRWPRPAKLLTPPIDKITEGQAEVLNLKSADAHAIIRARAFLNGKEGETKIDNEIDEAGRRICEILPNVGRAGNSAGSRPRLVETQRRRACPASPWPLPSSK